jgi:hypothetical protein
VAEIMVITDNKAYKKRKQHGKVLEEKTHNKCRPRKTLNTRTTSYKFQTKFAIFEEMISNFGNI